MNVNISVIIPVYNSDKHLEKCIKSVVSQSYRNIEIIIINDGSTDMSLQICQEYAEKDKRIIIVNQENSGVSFARNKGIELSKGKYITFIDSDDSIDENYLKQLLENSKTSVLAKCSEDNIKTVTFDKDEYIKKIVVGEIKGVCWGYLFEKEILEDIRFDTNTSYMEDTIFIIKYLLKVQKVKIVKTAFYNYLTNQESLTQNKKNITQRINGYMYSINTIMHILKENKCDYVNILEKRKIKLLESDIAKVENERQLEEIIKNIDVEQFLHAKNIDFLYKIYLILIKKKHIKIIMIYIHIRKKIKKILKILKINIIKGK